MRNIVVAGGTDGLGLEIVRCLSKNEENKLFVLGRDPTKLSEFGNKVEFIKLDITKESEVENLSKTISDNIDILIISVGIFGHGPLSDFSYDQIRTSIETNFLGHVFLTKSLLPKLSNQSRIISINSISGINTSKERSLLCGAKWGLRGFYNSLQEELKDKRVMISQIFPGYFDSDYMDKVGIQKDKTKAIDKAIIAQKVVEICELPTNIYVPEIQIKNISYT